MAGILRTFVFTVVLSLAAGCTRAPANATLLDRWVAQAGTDTDKRELVAEIKANRDVIEPQFIQAFRNGPGAGAREAIENSAERIWSLAQVQLAERESYNLDDGDIAEITSLSLEKEKSRAWETFDHNFRAAALLGIGVTQLSPGKALLEQVAADPSSRFRLLAADALAYK